MVIRLLINDRIYDIPTDLQQEIASMLAIYSEHDANDEAHLHKIGLRRVTIASNNPRSYSKDDVRKQ